MGVEVALGEVGSGGGGWREIFGPARGSAEVADPGRWRVVGCQKGPATCGLRFLAVLWRGVAGA